MDRATLFPILSHTTRILLRLKYKYYDRAKPHDPLDTMIKSRESIENGGELDSR